MGEWQHLLATAQRRTQIDGGIALRFAPDPDIAGALARLAVLEHGCWGFFDFRLRVADRAIGFEVRTPPEAHGAVSALLSTHG